jgi:hypothetical protein
VATTVIVAGLLAPTVAIWRMFAPAAPLPMDVTAGKLSRLFPRCRDLADIFLVVHHHSLEEEVEEEQEAAKIRTPTTLVPATQVLTFS